MLNLAVTEVAIHFSQGKSSVILDDRALEDQEVFAKALLLAGKLSDARFTDPSKLIELLKHRGRAPNRAIILCLVKPATSLERMPRWERPGRVMNSKFLPFLYEQYLRFHHERIQHPQLYPYICLDMSCANFEKNQHLFNQAVNKILEYYKKV